TSYMTLAYGKALKDEVIARIAAKHNATPAQVILAWAMGEGYSLAALYRLLQGTHDIRVIGVIFAAVDVLQQAARANGFARQPGA
ncbi:hypothetical protein MJH54_28585, partial [Salmonella enterica subsp. enterica serovar Montevideo]|nr:hypothetical protein [Salmonella enterica subsp. enterica serovar Montevideo]